MPELPEIEITARLLGGALAGAVVESVAAPGVNVLKSVEPPLSALVGRSVVGVRRRGKHFIVDFAPGDGQESRVSLLVHLMSAGRLQLYETRASPRDRTSRLLVRLRGGESELRLREFGPRQMAWAKLLDTSEVERDQALEGLGPEAWPTPPLDFLRVPRQLHTLLRDQRVIAGIGRSWADEVLWEARLPPFKRGADLSPEELEALREAIETVLGGAVEHYRATVKIPVPDKMPMPLQVHRREGEPCRRCGAELQAVHFSDHVVAYCPTCQTGGQKLKDRKLSRLLK